VFYFGKKGQNYKLIQGLLTELEEKLLQCFGHDKRIVRVRVPRKVLGLEYKRKRQMG
jgi:hypothetical protein